MPQKRNKDNRRLPTGWRFRKGFFWYRVPDRERELFDGKAEFKLGRTEAEAYEEWARRKRIQERAYTLRQGFTRYRAEVMPKKAASTQKQRSYSLPRLMTAFGDLAPHELTPSMIYRYRDHVSKVKSQKWANVDMETLSHALSCMIEWGDLDRHPMRGLRFKFSAGTRKHRVTDQDLIAFAETLPRKWQLYISLKLLTRGRRKGEILRLTVNHLTKDGIQFRNNKPPYDEYLVEWTPELRTVVEEILAIPPRRIGSAHLFLTRNGRPYIDFEGDTSSFNTMWTRYMAKAVKMGHVSERFTENDLRKKAVDGESLQRAQELLRHTTAQTTKKHYTIQDRIKTK